MMGGTGDGEKNPHIGVYADISSFSTTKFFSFPNYMLLDSKRITESFIIMSVGWTNSTEWTKFTVKDEALLSPRQ